MLFLRTGLPGSGKTLNTIREIELEHAPISKHPNKPSRTIYYYGIPDLDASKLKCNWVEFDNPDEWFNLPDGSVIVIDEAQRVFGAQDGRKARPDKVARFETHRHQGLDIHLITQHPTLLMSHVRKLVGKHIHMYRPYGGNKLRRYEYEFCIDKPELRSNFKLAQMTPVKLDKRYMGVYKSATVHTHKFKLPNYFWYIFPLVFFILACLSYVLYSYSAESETQPDPVQDKPGFRPIESPSSANPLEGVQTVLKDRPLTDSEYLASFQPRVPGVPSSAPRYDKLTQAKTIPRLICAASFDFSVIERGRAKGQPIGNHQGRDYTCQCYTQQVTRVQTTAEFCLSVNQNGYFDDTIPDRKSSGRLVETAPAATGRVPAAQLPPPQSISSPVTIVADSEYPSRPWR